jgi:hypothetical protein
MHSHDGESGLSGPETPVKSKVSPLVVIAAFVSLTETVCGAVIALSSGQVQLYLAYFVIAFPVGVASAFFLILVRKHWVLYAPWEYPDYIQLAEFRGQFTLPVVDAEAQTKALETKIRSSGLLDMDEVKKIVESIQQSDISIDSRPLLGSDGTVWRLPYEQFPTVQDFIDTVWLSLPRERVGQYSYGKQWVLRDEKSGQTLEIGSTSRYARKVGSRRRDCRTLEQAGISRGMRISVGSPFEERS